MSEIIEYPFRETMVVFRHLEKRAVHKAIRAHFFDSLGTRLIRPSDLMDFGITVRKNRVLTSRLNPCYQYDFYMHNVWAFGFQIEIIFDDGDNGYAERLNSGQGGYRFNRKWLWPSMIGASVTQVAAPSDGDYGAPVTDEDINNLDEELTLLDNTDED